MSNQSLGAERRPDKTYSKHVMLTEFGRIQIEAWAKKNNINFSAAIETLALLGLEDARADYAIPALRATTLQGIQLAFNRLARLLSEISLDAAVGRMMSEALLLQTVRELVDSHPDDFDTIMRVPRGSRQKRDVLIRQFHDDVKEKMAQAAAQKLRQPITELKNLLQENDEAAG